MAGQPREHRFFWLLTAAAWIQKHLTFCAEDKDEVERTYQSTTWNWSFAWMVDNVKVSLLMFLEMIKTKAFKSLEIRATVLLGEYPSRTRNTWGAGGGDEDGLWAEQCWSSMTDTRGLVYYLPGSIVKLKNIGQPGWCIKPLETDKWADFHDIGKNSDFFPQSAFYKVSFPTELPMSLSKQ